MTQEGLLSQRFVLFILAILMSVAFMMAGCSSTRTVKRTTYSASQTASSDRSPENETMSAQNNQTNEANDETNNKEVTKTETTEVKSQKEHSLVGSIFNAIGEVVAFPFRMIGALFDAIF